MKPLRSMRSIVALLLACSVTGCGPHTKSDSHDHHDHDHGHAHDAHDAHGEQGEKQPAGATFEAGRGVTLSKEMQESIGLEIGKVVEKSIARTTHFTVGLLQTSNEKTQTHPLVSGTVPSGIAQQLSLGQSVVLRTENGSKLEGRIERMDSVLARIEGEVEVLVAFSNQVVLPNAARFFQATLQLPDTKPALVIPSSAVLRTSQGTFLYLVAGDAFLRRAVQIGFEGDGTSEVTVGVGVSDIVVTRAIESLYLVETSATSAGGHSH